VEKIRVPPTQIYGKIMLYSLDINACVINGASLNKISAEYRPLVDLAVESLKNKLPNKLHSIYIRGSVSAGRAQPYISDLDLVAILYEALTDEEMDWRKNLSQALCAQYPFVTFIDLTCITHEELFTAQQYCRLRVYLATQSVCLYGENILGDLEKVKPSKKLFFEMYQGLDTELEELTKYFLSPLANKSYLGEVQPAEFWCVWAMRTILRSGLGLVMCSRPVYTQDLPTCYEEFSKEFPEYEGYMKHALVWAHTPTSDKGVVSEYLKEFMPKYKELWEKAKSSNY
jgi:uncharacterized protein